MTLLARDPAAPLDGDLSGLGRVRARPGTDWVLVGAALALALLGAVLVWSATRSWTGQSYLYRHLGNVAIAAVLCLLASRTDARLLRFFGPAVYLASLLGLLLVFAVGSTVNGAHAWIRVGGGFALQPAEFTKLGLLAALAVLFAARGPGARTVLIALVLLGIPLGMIMLQPDLGSATVLAAATFGVLVAAGVRARWTVGLLAAGVGGAVLAVKAGLLASYQLDRFWVFAHPGLDVQGAGYNVHQVRIAVAYGGLTGQGLFDGTQTQGGFVPEQQTDFVYSVAAEELGLLGAAAIIVAFAVLAWRGLRIAAEADDTGRLLAAGIVCWLAFQAFQNIGMNLGLTPVTGLPLPFVSYGGSSMFAQGIAVGLLLAIRRRSVGAVT